MFEKRAVVILVIVALVLAGLAVAYNAFSF